MATYLIGNVKGPKGEDGYSPKANVQRTSNGAVITVQDQSGTTSAFIRDGVDADGHNIDLTIYATKVEVQDQIDDLADTYATKTELEDIDIPVTSVNGMTGDVVITPPDLTGYATEAWIQQQGYMTEAPVATVNGQTGTVVLDAEDVGALPDSTVIPTKVSDLTNDSNFVSNATLNSLLQGKQDTLTAGENITITNNVISAAGGGATYTAGDAIEIDNNTLNVLADGTTIGFNASNQLAIVASYTPLNVYQAGIASKQDKLRAGANISISDDYISAVDTTYTAGENVSITNNEISVPDIEFVDASSNPNLTGVDAVARIDAHELYTGLEANGTEVGYFRINPEEGGIFGGSTFYNKEQSWTPNGVSFTDTSLNKTVTLAPNSDFTNLTIGGDDVVTVGELRPYVKSEDLSDYAEKTYVDRGLALKQDTLSAGTNITIDRNNVISVDGLSLTENSQSIQGATNTTVVSGGKVDISVAASGNELGNISLDAERGGMFGESAIYNKAVSLGMTGLQFGDTANGIKSVTLAPNANYDGFTINGVDIPTLPTTPATDGQYFLTATVSNGVVTHAWTSIPAANGNNF